MPLLGRHRPRGGEPFSPGARAWWVAGGHRQEMSPPRMHPLHAGIDRHPTPPTRSPRVAVGFPCTVWTPIPWAPRLGECMWRRGGNDRRCRPRACEGHRRRCRLHAWPAEGQRQEMSPLACEGIERRCRSHGMAPRRSCVGWRPCSAIPEPQVGGRGGTASGRSCTTGQVADSVTPPHSW